MFSSHPAPAPPALTRSLGLLGVLFLTLSVTTPASSLFVIVPGMFQAAGTGALWALLIAAPVCVATAFIYAELASAWPHAGGEYVMAARTLGPAAGFAMLGVNVFNNLLFPPVAALGVSAVAAAVLPGLPRVPTAIAVLLASTLVGVLNIRVNALVTGVFLIIEVVAIAVIATLGFAEPARGLVGPLLHPVMASAGGLVAVTPAAIGVATSIAIFALNGYGAAIYFAEEAHEAPRVVARAILLSLVGALVLEGVPIAAALIGTPDLGRFLAADDPFGGFVAARGGATLAGWVSLAVVVAILNAVIAAILATARFFYATARDRSWGRPLDRLLATIHPRLDSPVAATLLSGGIGLAACLLPLQFLLVLSGAGLVVIYAGIAAAAFAGRRSGATANAAYRMPLYPLAPLVTFAALAYVVWTSWLDPDEGRPGLIVTAAEVAASLAYYRVVLRGRGWTT